MSSISPIDSFCAFLTSLPTSCSAVTPDGRLADAPPVALAPLDVLPELIPELPPALPQEPNQELPPETHPEVPTLSTDAETLHPPTTEVGRAEGRERGWKDGIISEVAE